MINLLSPDDRRQLAASRTNSLLMRYTVFMGILIVALVVEIGGAYFLLGVDRSRNEAVIADNAAKTATFASTRQEAAAFQANLSIAKYVLSRQVPYTELLLTIARVLPPGTVVDRLTLDPSTFGTATTLTIRTSSPDSAISARQSLLKATVNGKPLFDSVSFASIADVTSNDSLHPYTATYNITYSKAVLPS